MNQLIVKYLSLSVLISLLCIISQEALAHSGGTARDGCHYDRSAGERHCHNQRTQESWDNQMQGYAESRSIGLWGWLVIGGGVWLAFQIFSKNDNRQGNSKSPLRNTTPTKTLISETEKAVDSYREALEKPAIVDTHSDEFSLEYRSYNNDLSSFVKSIQEEAMTLYFDVFEVGGLVKFTPIGKRIPVLLELHSPTGLPGEIATYFRSGQQYLSNFRGTINREWAVTFMRQHSPLVKAYLKDQSTILPKAPLTAIHFDNQDRIVIGGSGRKASRYHISLSSTNSSHYIDEDDKGYLDRDETGGDWEHIRDGVYDDPD